MPTKKKATAPKVAVKFSNADLKAFADEIRKQTGFHPPNWEQIVEEAIEKFRKKQREVQ